MELKEAMELKEIREDNLNLGYEEDMIKEFIEELEENEYPQDLCFEIADSYVEIYTSKLFEMYSNNLGLLAWTEEAEAQGLLEGEVNLIKIMQLGQDEYNSYLLSQVYNYLD